MTPTLCWRKEKKMRKFVDWLGRIPLAGMFAIIIVSQFTHGIVTSMLNVQEAKITQGFNTRIFTLIIVGYSLVLVMTAVDRFIGGTAKSRMINTEHLKILDRVLDSKVSNINNVASGKIFDVAKDIASMKADQKLHIATLLNSVAPAMVLIYKEWNYSITAALISTLSIPMGIAFALIAERVVKFSETAKAKKEDLHGKCSDNFINIRTLKYLGQKSFARKRLVEAQNEAWYTSINPARIGVFRIVDIIYMAPLIINVYLCRHSLEMIALIVVSDFALVNFRNNILGIFEYKLEIDSSEKIIKDLKGDDTEPRSMVKEDIVLDDIDFDYGEDSVKFEITHLKFNKGSKTLITGESGEGKSSLANLLAGGIEPKSGNVPRLDVFYVWQETESLDDTLIRNIIFDNPYNVSEDEIKEYFKKLNLYDWFTDLEDGFDTQIGERGCKLSSGQKQRINIIRAVIEMKNNPRKLFILDEITSNLDNKTKYAAIELLKEVITDEMTVIFISHNEGIEELCDNHILVENHKFYQSGANIKVTKNNMVDVN